MMNLKRRREEEEESEISFYGHGQTWLRGMKIAKDTSGSLYVAVRYKKRPNNPRVFDHNIAPGIITVKSAIADSDLVKEAYVLDNLHGCPHIRQMLGEEINMDDDMTERALESVEEAVGEVKNSGGGALESAKEVLEAAKEVVEAVEAIEEFKEMWRLTMSGDFIPLEVQEEGVGDEVEDMLGDFIPLALEKEEGVATEEESEVTVASPANSNVVDNEDADNIIPFLRKKRD